ncbi:nephrocystin-4 isoform X2 [Aplysia californica]|uniref:Nephrocystin-4 isoform X2 n=1 Tax=Aplysia californica TaxID=6500 RepID=A0ABM0JS68_APLCA|nr:nephrocystin-4 isoform X2 [Aplysia californica]
MYTVVKTLQVPTVKMRGPCLDSSSSGFEKVLQSRAQLPYVHEVFLKRKKHPGVHGVRVTLFSLTGLGDVTDRITPQPELEQPGVEYQLSLCLYDATYRQFFGRQWMGPNLAPRGSKLQYNKNVYFHTSIHNSNIILVVEVTAHSVAPNGRPQHVSCGWCFLRPFGSDSGMPDSSRNVQSQTQKIQLYHGSPRALYFMDEPLEGNQLLRAVEGCELNCSLASHKALLQIVSLLPENTLVDANDTVPGMVDTTGGDRFKKPRLQRHVPIEIDGLVLHLQPNVDKFEEELCNLMREDRSLRENRPKDSLDVCITERRLQVGVHNGWCYVEKPSVFHLEKLSGTPSRKPTASPSMRRSSRFHIRRNSTGSSSGGSAGHTFLVLKNKIQINELLEDPMCAVVFTLEYIIGEPLTAQDRRQSHSLARAHSRTVSVRWASWTPLLHPNTMDVKMALVGGPLRSPDDALVYKVPATSMQDQAVAVTAGGLLEFRWAKDGEAMMPSSHSLAVPDYRGIGSAGSLRSDGSEALMFDMSSGAAGDYMGRKPPIGKFRPQAAAAAAAAAAAGMVPDASGMIQYPGGHMAQYPGGHMAQFPGGHMAMPQMTVAQQQLMSMSSMYPQMYTPPAGLQPMGIMHMQETAAQASELRDLPFTPVHALSLAPGPLPRGGRGLSRAAYARLYAAGFPPLLDRNGDPPEVIDPQGHHLVNLTKEQADPLQSNELIFQFLAYSKEPSADAVHAQGQGHPATVFFSFQFYRFPQVTTERMLLSKATNDLSSNPQAMPFILQRLNADGSVMEGPPGLEVKYSIDPTYLKPGEVSLFWQHLSRQTMHIDVWDGDSLLLIGSSSVELKYLFRGGNEAVQTTFELDVLTTEYQEDSSALTGDVTRGGSVRPVGVNCVNRGRLHFRLANIGYPVDRRKTGDFHSVPSKTQVVVSQTAGNSSFKGGSLSAIIPPAGTKKVRVARAKNLTENREVASLLFSEQKKLEALTLGDEEELKPREGDAERQRKLARLQAVKAKEMPEEDNKAVTTIMGYRRDKSERTRDYKTIDIYRHQTKHEGILNMLNTSITSEHVLFPSFGTAEFFEFVLRNPFNHEQTLTIEISDPELHLITDAREWRHYKQLSQLTTPVEEGMFTSASSDKKKPQIFLRPKETVNIPLKFQTFKTDMSVLPQGPSNPFSKVNRQTEMDKTLEPRMVRVLFRSQEGKVVAILNIKVEPQPHVVDQTFRFHHPENSFLKKSVRLPPFHTLPGAPVGGGGISQVFVRCSDPNVVLDCKPTQPGEPHDIFMKVALAASPQIKRFFVCAYIDPFLSRPTQIWQCYVHALQRVDVSCVEGQTSRISLLLKGTQATRLVKVFSSHPEELQMTPQDPFILAAGTVHEVTAAVRPVKSGSKFFYLHVVDMEYHQLVRAWLLCASCRSPIVSRAFELTLPVGGGKNNSKRITYTNPYPVPKRFHLLCDRNDLLQFKEPLFELEGGASQAIGLRFMPIMQPGSAEIMVFINDEEDKNEETFRVTATYKFM